jgi:hypothetical protein
MIYTHDISFTFNGLFYGAKVDVDWEWVDDSIADRNMGAYCPSLSKVLRVVDEGGQQVIYTPDMKEAIEDALESIESPRTKDDRREDIG